MVRREVGEEGGVERCEAGGGERAQARSSHVGGRVGLLKAKNIGNKYII